MKAILEFNLPEEREDYELHCKAVSMHIAIHDFEMWMRKIYKYGSETDQTLTIEQVRKEFYEIFKEVL